MVADIHGDFSISRMTGERVYEKEFQIQVYADEGNGFCCVGKSKGGQIWLVKHVTFS